MVNSISQYKQGGLGRPSRCPNKKLTKHKYRIQYENKQTNKQTRKYSKLMVYLNHHFN